MNMEELTKSQIVLLTLLVSFVTSIATGIVTVSLVEQAPPAITQSVSRVIQETVQTVAPATGSQHAAASVTQEKTVVINQSDLISAAVTRAMPSLVRLFGQGEDGNPVFLGMGVVLSSNGTVAVDSDSLGDSADASMQLSDGSYVRGFVRDRDLDDHIAYLVAATSSAAKTSQWIPIAVSADHVLLGQPVIDLAGRTMPRISSGLAISLVPSGSASSSPQIIDTDLKSTAILPGSPLIDTQGALIGISTGLSRATSASGFLSSSVLKGRP